MSEDENVTVTVRLEGENDHQYGVARGDDLVWLPKRACEVLKRAEKRGEEMTLRLPADLARAMRLA